MFLYPEIEAAPFSKKPSSNYDLTRCQKPEESHPINTHRSSLTPTRVENTTFLLIYFQQDATLHSLFLENCSTCFGWYLHPSSGAHTTVFTAPYWKHIKQNILAMHGPLNLKKKTPFLLATNCKYKHRYSHESNIN